MQRRFYLSEAEKKSFRDNGFAGPFTLYEPDEMRRIWNDVRLDLLDTAAGPFPDSRLNYDRHLDVPALNRIISSTVLVDRVCSILGPDVLNWRTEWSRKYPGDEGTDWHQSEGFAALEGTEKLEPTAAEEGRPWELTAWVAMTPATRANGCLKLMPGSHRTGFFDEKRNIPFAAWTPDASRAVHMELAAGQFFLFTSRCMHGANPNTTKDSVRFGWSARFVPTHVKVYAGQDAFHHFGEKLPLERYTAVQVAGVDRFGHNRIAPPMRQDAAVPA